MNCRRLFHILLPAALLWAGLAVDLGPASSKAGLEEADALIKQGEFAAALEALLPFAYQGIADAQYKVGVIYDYGRQAVAGQTVPENPFEAAKWYGKAAAQGHPLAQRNLGACYEAGRGVQMDAAEAARWYRAAALQGDAFAQYSLGMLYAEGRGVARDPARAYAWLVRGLNVGLLAVQQEKAVETLRLIESELSDDEIAAALQMAKAPPGSRLAP